MRKPMRQNEPDGSVESRPEIPQPTHPESAGDLGAVPEGLNRAVWPILSVALFLIAIWALHHQLQSHPDVYAWLLRTCA